MGILTDFLNLFKKEPIIDKDDTFNITTMLNENWDKIDAFAESLNQKTDDHIEDAAEHVQLLPANAFSFAEPGVSYPVGISVFQFNASGIGFPTAGGQVLTIKTNDDRVSQIITETTITSPKQWYREFRVSAGAWSDLLLNVTETSGDARYVKKAGDTMTGALTFNTSANLRIHKNILTYTDAVSTMGALKIKLPSSNLNTMMKLKISGYDYVASSGGTSFAWDLNLGAYKTSAPNWSQVSAVLLGKSPFSKVRFAYDGTSHCIIIGDLTTVWSFPKIAIDFMAGHTGYELSPEGWDISIIASEVGITNIVEPTLQGVVPSWTKPTLLNGWVDFGSTFELSNYVKDLSGFVHLKGMIKSGTITAGTNLFVLDSNHRPFKDTYILTVSANLLCVLEIKSATGEVKIVTGASAAWINLNNISFKAGE